MSSEAKINFTDIHQGKKIQMQLKAIAKTLLCTGCALVLLGVANVAIGILINKNKGRNEFPLNVIYPVASGFMAMSGGIAALLLGDFLLQFIFPCWMTIVWIVYDAILLLFSGASTSFSIIGIISCQTSYGNCIDNAALLTTLCAVVLVVSMAIFTSAYFTIKIHIYYCQIIWPNKSCGNVCCMSRKHVANETILN